ncbi:general transcription factor II-I repeat domain-containing protein 2-like [Watersipora subatra]|uniref:general transcription factor II-I repeat domain-containing protein 2-like n=1 Tax=Watersipora subatra TaxID=2589382 RepID=UPI00355B7ECB
MIEEIECEYKDVAYYFQVRWLSSAETLRKFNSLLPEIDLFMRDKGRECDEFREQFWITDLAFLADITEHLSVGNFQLQGKKQDISQLWRYITAFRTKLELWERQLQKENYAHFFTSKLCQSANERLKQQHLSDELIEFHHDFFSAGTCPALHKHAFRMVSLFGSAYLCEQFFSRMKSTKSKYRTGLTNAHLAQQLRISFSDIKPDLDRIVGEKQYQVAH